MEKAIEYRGLAARLRREAALATLERVRGLKMSAADQWDRLAAEVELVIAPANPRATAGWIF